MRWYFRLTLFALFLGGCVPQSIQNPNRLARQHSFDRQMDVLTQHMVKSLDEEQKKKIAIMEFPDLNGNVSELGKFIAEELTTRFFVLRRFEVVERQLLHQVLQEQKLGMEGLIDFYTASEIGKILGVDAIVTGTIADVGTVLRLNARMIATTSAEVFAATSVTVTKTEHLSGMMATVHPTTLPSGRSTARSTASGCSGRIEQVDIRLVRISHTQDKLELELIAENKGKTEYGLRFWSDSRLVTSEGDEFSFRQVGESADMNKQLMPDVPMRLRVRFRVPAGVQRLSLIELQFQYTNDKLVLRDVPIPYGE